MTFKPTTYLTSFAMFVILFMGTGVYLGWQKISDHLLAQAYLEAAPIRVQVAADGQGPLLGWEDRVPLAGGAFVRIAATNRTSAVAIQYSDDPASQGAGIPLAAHERTEDIRVDRAGRYLYLRVLGDLCHQGEGDHLALQVRSPAPGPSAADLGESHPPTPSVPALRAGTRRLRSIPRWRRLSG